MKIDRRTVIQGLCIAGTAGAFGVGISFLARKSEGKTLLRPPGALEESDFLASCIKCGQCIQVCPFGSISLLDLSGGINTATPYIDPVKRGCYLCDLFPCILCCPSGALDDEVQKIDQVHMGVAYVTEPKNCLNYKNIKVSKENVDRIKAHGDRTELEKELNEKLTAQVGKDCELCLEVCRVEPRDGAIKLTGKEPVIGRSCVGCGACEEICPASIIKRLCSE